MILHNYKVLKINCIQARSIYYKDSSKKAKFVLKMTQDGQMIEPKIIKGYNPDEVDKFVRWLRKTAILVGQEVGAMQGPRFIEYMNLRVKDYIETDFGIKRSIDKAEAKRRREIRKKIRNNKRYSNWHNDWHKLEDMKESRILRDKQRETSVDRLELFSFNAFLKAEREKKMTPYIIEDEETFRQKIKDLQEKYLFWGPRDRFTKFRKPIGYWHKLQREIWDPWVYELRRRGKVMELVQEREEAIAKQKWNQMLEERRSKRMQERQEDFDKQLVHWNETLGEWHKENNTLRKLKEEYMRKRKEIETASRREFLQILDTDSDKWVESPNECRFLRFRFAEGVTWPPNKAAYI